MIIPHGVREIVRLALAEDLPGGDVTTDLCGVGDRPGVARLLGREKMIFCGKFLISAIIEEARSSIQIVSVLTDGTAVQPETVLGELRGPVGELLMIERTILNFLQRLSGIATNAREIVEAHPQITILDTRKTIPGWRLLDKYAVRCGGAKNHRGSLSEMILVKNNHVDIHPAGMKGVLEAIYRNKPIYMPVEVEVRNLDELKTALSFEPEIVMLDNFSDDQVRLAMNEINQLPRRPRVEVSGNVTPSRLSTLATIGVDAVSMGALTNKARSVDISMRITSRTDAQTP